MTITSSNACWHVYSTGVEHERTGSRIRNMVIYFLLIFAAITAESQTMGSRQPEQGPPNIVSQDDLPVLHREVNFVEVPITVKDTKGNLVTGLTKPEFQVYEEGVLQEVSFFTDDPLPMSIAVLVDMGMPNIEVIKVQQTLTAMIGSFSQFDEVAVYEFSSTVSRLNDFQDVGPFTGRPLQATLQKLTRFTGVLGGVPMNSGPFATGPRVNGADAEPYSRAFSTVPATDGTLRKSQMSRVLNDAIMIAVQDLAKRPQERRKILFVLSDGKEFGSQARDDEVLRALLSYPISLFAVAIGEGALPVYEEAGRTRYSSSSSLHILSGLTIGHALPRYAEATGGDVFPAYDEKAIERAYSKALEEARYRYTLGFHSRRAPTGYYSIEVRLLRPGAQVLTRRGYYPAPDSP